MIDFSGQEGDSSEMIPTSRAKDLLQMRNPNMTQILTAKKERLELELSEVNEALAALKANPEIERVINLVTKIRH